MTDALGGLRVIDMAHGLAGPFAATLLGEFGAEVIKVESPGGGDFMRGLAAPHAWRSVARNKRSISIDLKNPAAVQVMSELVKVSDVLVESYRPGVLEELGLAPDVLLGWNPDLVVLRISGYGQTGPRREQRGFGKIAEAFSGLADVTGFPGSPPVHLPFGMTDFTTGLTGAFGILVALRAVSSGAARGQVIDLALYDPLLRLLDVGLAMYGATGVIPERAGNRQVGGVALANVYQTKDGRWLTYSAGSEKIARRLLSMIGGEDLLSDPRFSTFEAMCANQDEIDEMLGSWVSQRSSEEAQAAFHAAGAVAAIINNIGEALADEQVRARGNVVAVNGARMVAPIPSLSATPGKVRALGPDTVGEHGPAVLREVLGWSDAQCREAIAAGAVGAGGPDAV